MKNIFKSFAIVLVIVFGFFLFVSSNHFFGLRSFIVKSGSMEPAIPTGALVITQYTHPTELKTGDVITFIRPTEEKDFITHRVLGISTKNEYTRLQTKGDNNTAADNWEVSGGNVVGKVNFSVPYLGYVISFVQSKLGILLFILVPSIYILVDEVSAVIKMLRKKEAYASQSVETALVLIVLLFGLTLLQTNTTQALLEDKVTIPNNTFTVVVGPTITPSAFPTTISTISVSPTILPTSSPCNNNTAIAITGNAAGSNTSVTVNNPGCQTVITQSNSSTVSNSVHVAQTTGGNTTSYNTGGNINITTSDSTSEVITKVRSSVNGIRSSFNANDE